MQEPEASAPVSKGKGATWIKEEKMGPEIKRYALTFMSIWMKVARLCLTLCDPMDCLVHGILQAKILEWVAFPFSRESSQPRNQTRVSCIAGGFFTNWAIREAKRAIYVCINTDRTRPKSILSYELHIFTFLCLAKSTNIYLLLKKNYLLLVQWEVKKVCAWEK